MQTDVECFDDGEQTVDWIGCLSIAAAARGGVSERSGIGVLGGIFLA